MAYDDDDDDDRSRRLGLETNRRLVSAFSRQNCESLGLVSVSEG